MSKLISVETKKPEHLYVLEFSCGLVKIGRSINPETRIKAHAQNVLAISGSTLERDSVLEVGSSAVKAEHALISFCSDRWEQRSREWFFGADYWQVVHEAFKISNMEWSGKPIKKARMSYMRNRIELTNDIVDSFRCFEGVLESYLYDSVTPELGVRAYAYGKKSFIRRFTRDGRTTKKTIGPVAVGLDFARTIVSKELQEEAFQ